MNILEQANQIVHGARNESYGDPIDNHGLTGEYWSVYLATKLKREGNLNISPEDVCFLNILQKISRSQNGVNKNIDTLIDTAGYAANIEMILQAREERQKQ